MGAVPIGAWEVRRQQQCVLAQRLRIYCQLALKRSAETLTRFRIKQEPKRWLAWVRKALAARGMHAASRDVYRGTIRRYAAMLASDILEKGACGEPLLCIPEILTGDDEGDYWIAAMIWHMTKDWNT